jgi:hypothetical protein
VRKYAAGVLNVPFSFPTFVETILWERARRSEWAGPLFSLRRAELQALQGADWFSRP